MNIFDDSLDGVRRLTFLIDLSNSEQVDGSFI